MSAVLRKAGPQSGPNDRSQESSGPETTRVMLVDDSLTVRTVFARMVDRESDLEVVAQAGTAEQALMTLRGTTVDVILLDLEMPGMGGIEALPKLLETAGSAQVLVVSSLTADGAEATMTALQIGAADTMLKPRPGGFDENYKQSLLGKIRALGGKHGESAPVVPVTPVTPAGAPRKPKVIAIGASTGGIHAINLFLRSLPTHFDLPLLITQHLPETFIPVFAHQVETVSGRKARLADEGVPVTRGEILIAPGHGHMILRRQGDRIFSGLAYHAVPSGCRPSVDPMFESAAEVYDGHVSAVLLSGMGRDGSEGARSIAAAGGAIFAQDEASSAVWGMPRTVAENGLATAVLPPEQLAARVVAMAGSDSWR